MGQAKSRRLAASQTGFAGASLIQSTHAYGEHAVSVCEVGRGGQFGERHALSQTTFFLNSKRVTVVVLWMNISGEAIPGHRTHCIIGKYLLNVPANKELA